MDQVDKSMRRIAMLPIPLEHLRNFIVDEQIPGDAIVAYCSVDEYDGKKIFKLSKLGEEILRRCGGVR